jgi:predicted TIM-barrel fold metal-dependent hydrolase
MKITDAQVHIYEPDTPEQRWPREPGRSAAPDKHARGFSALQMLGAMEAVGVDRAVIVPPAWSGENNAPALAAAANHPGKFVVMGRIDPYAEGSPERLERWLDEPHMRGIRMSGRWSTLDKQFYEALDDPALGWYWAACERLGIPIMILTGKYVSKLERLAQQHPRLVMIIDHLSVQRADSVAPAFGAYEEVRAVAHYPGIHIKVGNGPNASRRPYAFDDVHDYLRGIHQAFGARRMLWEADITQLTKNTYAECLRLWQEGLPFLSAEDREWVLARTAAHVLNWP